MNRIQLRPPPPSSEITSPPRVLSHVKSSIGYWIRDEELAFLNELLTLKRKVPDASAERGNGDDIRLADVVLEMELLQASFYDFLRKEIEARGGQAVVGSPCKETFKEINAKCDLIQAISIASCGQRELVEAIQKALSILPDSRLGVALAKVQRLRERQHLKDF